MSLTTNKPGWDGGEATRHFLALLAGLSFALVTAALLTPFLHPRGSAGTARAFALAIVVSLILPAFTIGAVWLASRILRIEIPGDLYVGTALLSAWFIPLLALANQKSWLMAVIWLGIAIQLGCVAILLRNLAPNDSPSGAGPASETPAFGCIKDHPVSGFALVAPFFAQAGVCALIASRLALADFLFFMAVTALAARGWRMLLDSPYPQPNPISPNMLRALAVIPTVLVIFIWLPRGVRDGTKTTGRGSGNSPHRIAPTIASDRKAQSILDRIFPGVVLYPVLKSTVQLIAPPSLEAQGMMGSPSKPFVIPFDGVYWFWRFPEGHPPETAVVKQGSPAKLIFHSTDGTALLMEAHQNLATGIDLQCCSAIELNVESADSRPDSIKVELLVSNTKLQGKPSQSLGVRQLSASTYQTLPYKIPHGIRLQSFDELTVRVHTQLWRGDKSANLAIRNFALIPRS
ncbi:MAG TPA: hypothetical protein VH088_01160 [Terriglobales bacterium]|jgi:hypothetical protein|nr:hypothetical protein [Terriglobales bacterium]